MCRKPRQAKFSRSNRRETFSNLELSVRGGRKMCIFNGKLAKSRKRWKIWPRLLLITIWKWHTLFRMKGKSSILDDLEGHWQPVRSAVLATAELVLNNALHLLNFIKISISESDTDEGKVIFAHKPALNVKQLSAASNWNRLWYALWKYQAKQVRDVSCR